MNLPVGSWHVLKNVDNFRQNLPFGEPAKNKILAGVV
jgi:hypothetical protein